MADRETATGDLGLVQAFINTVDLQDGPEELTDPNTLKAWLVANGLIAESASVDGGDLKHAIALREAMRGVVAANSGYPIYPVDVATLNHAAVASGEQKAQTTHPQPRPPPARGGGGRARRGVGGRAQRTVFPPARGRVARQAP